MSDKAVGERKEATWAEALGLGVAYQQCEVSLGFLVPLGR